jgi:hypothetical protein
VTVVVGVGPGHDCPAAPGRDQTPRMVLRNRHLAQMGRNLCSRRRRQRPSLMDLARPAGDSSTRDWRGYASSADWCHR